MEQNDKRMILKGENSICIYVCILFYFLKILQNYIFLDLNSFLMSILLTGIFRLGEIDNQVRTEVPVYCFK